MIIAWSGGVSICDTFSHPSAVPVDAVKKGVGQGRSPTPTSSPSVIQDGADATNRCVAQARQSAPFDAYYDPGDQLWHMFGNDDGTSYFYRCMSSLGFSLHNER
jgi:hypothetical protein